MNHWKKCGVILVLLLVSGVTMISSFAAGRKKIRSVIINVKSNIALGALHGDEEIAIEIRGKNYSYDYYEIENFGFEWSEDEVPEITIYLKADEGYYFSLTKANALKLTGASCVKMHTQDSSETLALRVKLPPMAEMLGQETEVRLNEHGLAAWDEVEGAGSYELRLYRDGIRVGTNCQSTNELFYDYADRMSRAGSYQVQVRAVNKHNSSNKGEWMESETITISKEMAAIHRETAAIRSETEAISSETAAIPSEAAGELPIKGEWKLEGNRWWYEHEDGTYTRNNWEMIDEKWYLFDEEGYIRTGWVEWEGEEYLLENEGHLKTQ